MDYDQNRRDLEAAIEKYTRDNHDREGVVTTSVVLTHTIRFDDDGDECFAYDYAVLHSGSPIAAVGLVELARRLMLSHTDGCSDGHGEDE